MTLLDLHMTLSRLPDYGLIVIANDFRSGWALLFFLLTFVGLQYFNSIKSVLESRIFFGFLAGGSLVLVLTYAILVVFDLFYPNYLDHFEATVSEISWKATHGEPIYPDWETGNIYEAPYGPLLFITNGLILRLFPTIFAVKLAGCIAFIIAVILSYLNLQKPGKIRMPTGVVCRLFMVIVVTFFTFGLMTFWSRSEPYLILISVLTVITSLKLPRAAAVIVIGILGGVAIDFKIHAGIYAMPAATAVCGAADTWRDRIRSAILFATVAALVAALPFFGAGASSIEEYISVLLMTAKQGLSIYAFTMNLLFATLLLMPIAITWYSHRPTLDSFDKWFQGGLFVALGITSIVASKPGAGPPHFLPLVPISVFCLLRVLEAPRLRAAPELFRDNYSDRKLAEILLASLLIFYGPRTVWWTMQVITNSGSNTEQMKIDELQGFYSRYSLAEVGLSDKAHYTDTFYRVLLVFQGAPLHVDFTSWSELQYAGVSESRLTGLLEHCDVPVWIVPKGEPFTMTNVYSGLPLLSERFRRIFLVKYTLIEEGRFYNIWKCSADTNRAVILEDHNNGYRLPRSTHLRSVRPVKYCFGGLRIDNGNTAIASEGSGTAGSQ
jgi:hypothetical protein